MIPRAQPAIIENRSLQPYRGPNYHQKRFIDDACKKLSISTSAAPNQFQRRVSGRPLSARQPGPPQRENSHSQMTQSGVTPERVQRLKGQQPQLSSARLVRNPSSTLGGFRVCSVTSLQALGAPVMEAISPLSTERNCSLSSSHAELEAIADSKNILANLYILNQNLRTSKSRSSVISHMTCNIADALRGKSGRISTEDIYAWKQSQCASIQVCGIRRNQSILKSDHEILDAQVHRFRSQKEQSFLGKDFIGYVQMLKRQKRNKQQMVKSIQQIQNDVYIEFDRIFNKIWMHYIHSRIFLIE
ncbi:hypothetical protein SS50377_20538 [Spironucleus salmonicida]|uniref:Uncharacterized protein n=1 Tax=Spironucleus salmonicida TaxID=348837 RepID=V6LHQ0_9EUKA|nr:hypothetical protein SS50377_20538 [Spironucleus salmonicida]|eukprot:EST43828.1 Hypothetical protein SS50377_16451 [Spironucleus salmonicida]